MNDKEDILKVIILKTVCCLGPTLNLVGIRKASKYFGDSIPEKEKLNY